MCTPVYLRTSPRPLLQLMAMDVMSPLFPISTPLYLLLASKPVTAALVESPVFLPPYLTDATMGSQMEMQTLLGVIMRLSAMVRRSPFSATVWVV